MSDSIPTGDKNRFQWRTVAALGASTWLVTTQLVACSDGADNTVGGEGEAGEGAAVQPLLNQGEGGEGEGHGGEGEGYGGEGEGEGQGGEGQGGEGEGATTAGSELSTDDVAYLTQLGLIRGHLAVGHALFTNDLPELAETHMKHPREEIYTEVVPAFAARGCEGFGDELSGLTAAVVERQSKTDVDSAYENLTNGIAACEATADTGSPEVLAKVIENLLRTAGIEYEIGIVGGAVNNLHEYQDAWGFTQIADALAKSNAFAGDAKAAAVAAQIQDVIADLAPMWPSLNPEGGVDGDAAQLYGAAAQVQVISLNLQR